MYNPIRLFPDDFATVTTQRVVSWPVQQFKVPQASQLEWHRTNSHKLEIL